MMVKGTKFTDEHKEKISDRLKGRIFSEEHRKKMSQAKKGKKSNCIKNVKIIYKNVEYNFESMKDAEDFFQSEKNLKIFYWLRNRIPKKYLEDIQYIEVGGIVQHNTLQ